MTERSPSFDNPLSRLTGGGPGSSGVPGTGIGGGGTRGGPGSGNIGTVYKGGDGITLPVLLHQVDPEYSEEARKTKYSGSVLLRIDVDATGQARNIRVVRSVGLGLDEKAAEAVARWIFRPGTKDGKPVAVEALVEVSFRLL